MAESRHEAASEEKRELISFYDVGMGET